MPSEYMPGGNRNARRKAARAVHRQSGNGDGLFSRRGRRSARTHGGARNSLARRSSRFGGKIAAAQRVSIALGCYVVAAVIRRHATISERFTARNPPARDREGYPPQTAARRRRVEGLPLRAPLAFHFQFRSQRRRTLKRPHSA